MWLEMISSIFLSFFSLELLVCLLVTWALKSRTRCVRQERWCFGVLHMCHFPVLWKMVVKFCIVVRPSSSSEHEIITVLPIEMRNVRWTEEGIANGLWHMEVMSCHKEKSQIQSCCVFKLVSVNVGMWSHRYWSRYTYEPPIWIHTSVVFVKSRRHKAILTLWNTRVWSFWSVIFLWNSHILLYIPEVAHWIWRVESTFPAKIFLKIMREFSLQNSLRLSVVVDLIHILDSCFNFQVVLQCNHSKNSTCAPTHIYIARFR